MVSVMMTPDEMAEHLASKFKAKRLVMNLSQRTLSDRSGVSYGVIKKFEQTSQISLASLLKLALTLEALADFYTLFDCADPEDASSLDELMADNTRKRGRQ